MNVNLRKAKAIQTSIFETIHALSIQPSVELNEFDTETVEKINTAESTLVENLRQRELLWNANYSIRRLVGSANEINGINDLLTKKAGLLSIQNDLKVLANASPAETVAAVRGRVAKLKSRESNGYGSVFETTTVSPLSQHNIASYKERVAENRKMVQLINDEVLERNVKNTIKLSDDIVELLKKHSIL